MRRASAFAVIALALHAPPALADPFEDPQDGRFDASEWLLDQKGFLPSISRSAMPGARSERSR
jgi:hypothetical protein